MFQWNAGILRTLSFLPAQVSLNTKGYRRQRRKLNVRQVLSQRPRTFIVSQSRYDTMTHPRLTLSRPHKALDESPDCYTGVYAAWMAGRKRSDEEYFPMQQNRVEIKAVFGVFG